MCDDAEKEYIENAIARYSPSLIRAAYNILGSLSEAEDVVQETFIKLYTRRPEFADAEHEKAWLLRVTINAARNARRRFCRIIPTDAPEDKAVFSDSEQREVFAAVCSLEEKYRIIIHLHYYEGYTIKQTAKLLGIPASTAGTRLERAKAQLRKKIDLED